MAAEFLFLGILLIDLFFIYLASRFGKLYLAVTLVMNIVVAVIFAGQIVELVGAMVGLSALFYAPIFVITTIVQERYGKSEAENSMRIGLFSLVVLLVLLFLGTSLPSVAETADVSGALDVLFHTSIRMILGTILSYYIAQMVTIYLYRVIGDVTKQKSLWLRHNAAIVIALGIDSVVFYPIAFYGVVSVDALTVVILTGWFIKCFVSIIATPVAYLVRRKR